MLSRRISLFVGSTALALAATVSVGWLVASGDGSIGGRPSGSDAATSDLNTASQKTFENSATLVDVDDDPVSLPSEKVIYPPSTGNAGLAGAETSALAMVALAAVAASLIAAARFATAARSGHR
jgi:hypothetical protein